MFAVLLVENKLRMLLLVFVITVVYVGVKMRRMEIEATNIADKRVSRVIYTCDGGNEGKILAFKTCSW